jgi:hypothetical protein
VSRGGVFPDVFLWGFLWAFLRGRNFGFLCFLGCVCAETRFLCLCFSLLPFIFDSLSPSTL